MTHTDGSAFACILLRSHSNNKSSAVKKQSEVTWGETVWNHCYFTRVTVDDFNVDSWRSASTDCPLNWRKGNQQCCYMQRGSSTYRLLSTLQEFIFSAGKQRRWKRIILCLQHDSASRSPKVMTPAERLDCCSSAWTTFLKITWRLTRELKQKTFPQLIHILL